MSLQQLSSRCQGNINVAICPKTQTILLFFFLFFLKHLYYNNGNIHLLINFRFIISIKPISLEKQCKIVHTRCDLALPVDAVGLS